LGWTVIGLLFLIFFSSDASVNLNNTFENSLILEDTTGISRVRIKMTLRHQISQINWVARIFDDNRYLMEAPNTRWHQQVTTHGALRIENVNLSAHFWDPVIDEDLHLRPVWILVRVFSMKLWYFHEFARIFEPYGQVLVLDPATVDNIDFRVACVRVGLCDKQDLPALL
jgi:Domain of unknown function (DUF4283)